MLATANRLRVELPTNCYTFETAREVLMTRARYPMTMEEPNAEFSDRAQAEKEAIAWFTRMNGKPSRVDKQNFLAWQRLSHFNEDAYNAISALWSSSVAPGAEIAREEALSLASHLKRIKELRKRKKVGTKAVVGTLAL